MFDTRNIYSEIFLPTFICLEFLNHDDVAEKPPGLSLYIQIWNISLNMGLSSNRFQFTLDLPNVVTAFASRGHYICFLMFILVFTHWLKK